MNVLDLFSGIGGFSLGLERAGMRTVAFCEIDPFCRQVLAKHWPGVPIHHDITKLRGADVGAVDVICGGFPCQDISVAGKGAGLEGERSGLWREYARIIGELRPRYVVVENVAALLGRGLDRVLGDLAALGFDAEWHCIPASAVGAPHRRDRVWIVAYANDPGLQGRLSNALDDGKPQELARPSGPPMADATGERLPRSGQSIFWRDAAAAPEGQTTLSLASCLGDQWGTEPDVGRVANGIPSRVDRLRSLGNAVVPQIPEIIGRAIMTACTVSSQHRAPQGE